MKILQKGSRSLGLMVELNFDWLMWPSAVLASLVLWHGLSGF